MALRVLLADESSTIKKVMQLALQDFAVEVRSVPNGLDVPGAIKAFAPDIIFADVLLTKKSGYDVCAEVKDEPTTQNIPVVLMWSSFMELDSTRYKSSRADSKLEKPFDADSLRSIVQKWVPKTKDQPLSAFLKFPKLPEFSDQAPANSSIDELGAPDDFAQVPLHDSKRNLDDAGLANSEDGWSQQSLAKFKLELPEEVHTDNQPSEKSAIDFNSVEQTQTEGFGEFEEIDFNDNQDMSRNFPADPTETIDGESMREINQNDSLPSETPLVPNVRSQPPSKANVQNLSLTPTLSEEQLVAEAQKIIESICWKILPDIAEKVIREELSKVMGSIEQEI